MNILVTGANQGIGYFMAAELLRIGHNVTVLDIDTSSLNELKEIHEDKLLPLVCDVCSDDEIEAAVMASVEKFGESYAWNYTL
jgi:NAD(P)-dependent dehydrogenase (short-subunit alcohol dehydrogenase family)